MSAIRECDKEAMLSSGEYTWLTVLPCVTVPLTIAMVFLSYAWYRLLKDWGQTHELARKGTVAILAVETIFGVPCWIQCIIFTSEAGFYGDVPGCEFQAWYAGFYTFSWPLVVGFLSILTGQVYSSTQVDEQTSTLTVEETPKKSHIRQYLATILTGCILWGSFVALWPALGILNSGYIYQTFCVTNFANPAFGTVYAISFLFMCGALFYGFKDILSKHWIYLAIPFYAFFNELMVFILSISGFSGNYGCGDNPFGIPIKPAYGVLAYTQHLNQLLTPIVFGIYWKREINSLFSSKLNNGAVGGSPYV